MIGQKKPQGRPIPAEKLELLRVCYSRGYSVAQAVSCAGVTSNTTYRKFHEFKRDGVERATPWPYVRKAPPPPPKYPGWRLPSYRGPTMIGKAIDTDSRI